MSHKTSNIYNDFQLVICNICHTKHYSVALYFKLCMLHRNVFFILSLKICMLYIFCQLKFFCSYSGLGKIFVCTKHWHMTWYPSVTPSHLHQTFASSGTQCYPESGQTWFRTFLVKKNSSPPFHLLAKSFILRVFRPKSDFFRDKKLSFQPLSLLPKF